MAVFHTEYLQKGRLDYRHALFIMNKRQHNTSSPYWLQPSVRRVFIVTARHEIDWKYSVECEVGIDIQETAV